MGFAIAGVLLSTVTASARQPDSATGVNFNEGYYTLDDQALPSGAGAAGDTAAVGTGPEWNVLNWGPGPIAVVPSAFAMDTVVDGRTRQRVLVSSQANQDVATADPITNMSFSDDSAVSFLNTEQNARTNAENITRMPDGSLLSIGTIPEWVDAAHTKVFIYTWRSRDQGRTWTGNRGIFTPPDGKQLGPMNRGLRVHRAPTVLADGTIVAPAYTAYQGRPASSIFLQSTDGGRNWTERGEIPSSVGTNEIGWSHTTDGRLIAVVRTVESPARLRVSYSQDEGRSWSATEPLLGPDGNQIVGIYPDLVLQPNGILLLSTGRPDDHLLVSFDGTGRRWDVDSLVHANPPSMTGNGRYDGSSGNTALINVGANRSVFIGDKCHVWGCQGYNEQYGVFASYVSAVGPGEGKLDLATQIATGVGTVTGTFARGSREFPETRPEGAFDGSSRPHSAAILHARKGIAPSMVIRLDREYSLDRIGLMLGAGQPLDATVELSTDGHTWSAPVVSAQGRRDFAMHYTTFSPEPARFVRVSAPAGRDTPVTEMELYSSDTQTFENDPIFSVPRGFTAASSVTTTDQLIGGHNSRTSMRLWDKYLDKNATATKMSADTDRQRTSFDWATSDFRGPFEFGIKGHKGGTVTTPWRFRLVPGTTANPAQTLESYDGASWSALGQLTTPIALNIWTQFVVDATPDHATVTVDGHEFSTSEPDEPTGTLAGVAFSTGDPEAYGMTFYLDDLSIG